LFTSYVEKNKALFTRILSYDVRDSVPSTDWRKRVRRLSSFLKENIISPRNNIWRITSKHKS